MKIYFKSMCALSFLFLFCATTCNEDNVNTCDDYLEQMQSLKLEIDALINSDTCTENTECSSIAFGSKPCGGPWSYLVYPTSIDIDQLESMVAHYNTLEDNYNNNCDAVSDCMFVTPPVELSCEDGKCNIVN